MPYTLLLFPGAAGVGVISIIERHLQKAKGPKSAGFFGGEPHFWWVKAFTRSVGDYVIFFRW